MFYMAKSTRSEFWSNDRLHEKFDLCVKRIFNVLHHDITSLVYMPIVKQTFIKTLTQQETCKVV